MPPGSQRVTSSPHGCTTSPDARVTHPSCNAPWHSATHHGTRQRTMALGNAPWHSAKGAAAAAAAPPHLPRNAAPFSVAAHTTSSTCG
jgi:hypothetical protein